MKKIKYTWIVALSLLLFSCQKEFLETKPTDQVAAKNAFESLDNAYAALNGTHRLMYYSGPDENQDEFGEESVMIRRDMLGEDLCMTSAGNGWFNNSYKWIDHRNSNSTSNLYPWKFYYRIIANANAIINGLNTNLAGLKNEVMYKYVMAQALTYRAWAHFNLVQLYAKRYDPSKKGSNSQDGVVLKLTADVKAEPRSSVEAVYQQINTDLDAAIASFNSIPTDKYPSGQISDLSTSAAQAIKARVALTTGEWQVAIDNATAAMVGHGLFKAADFTANAGFPSAFSSFPGDGSEWIWGSQVKTDQGTGFASFFAYMSWNFSSTNVRGNPKTISKELYDAMPATDARKAMFSANGYDIIAKPSPSMIDERALGASYESKKFSATGPAESSADIAYIRVAEMYLIVAEAQARLTHEPEARQALFTLVSTRDKAYTLSNKTGQSLIDEILLQRRIELWGEGFRFLDLKRLDLPLNRETSKVTDPGAPYTSKRHLVTSYAGHHNPALCSITSVPAGDSKWQWLIPTNEINSNTNIKQND